METNRLTKLAVMILLSLALVLCFATGAPAVADDHTVTIAQSDTVVEIELKIQAAITAANGNGTVTVSGSKTGAEYTMELNIPAGVTVKWSASYSGGIGSYSSLIYLSGSGSFEIVAGGSVIKNETSAAIRAINSVAIIVSGGMVEATGFSATAIYTSSGNVTITGGKVAVTGEDGRAIYTDFGSVDVSGGEVKATGEDGISIYTADGDVTVSGGKVEATAKGGIAIYTTAGDVIVSGGTVISSVDADNTKVIGVVTEITPIIVWSGYPINEFVKQYQKVTIHNTNGLEATYTFSQDFRNAYSYFLNGEAAWRKADDFWTGGLTEEELAGKWRYALDLTDKADTFKGFHEGDIVQLTVDEHDSVKRIANYIAYEEGLKAKVTAQSARERITIMHDPAKPQYDGAFILPVDAIVFKLTNAEDVSIVSAADVLAGDFIAEKVAIFDVGDYGAIKVLYIIGKTAAWKTGIVERAGYDTILGEYYQINGIRVASGGTALTHMPALISYKIMNGEAVIQGPFGGGYLAYANTVNIAHDDKLDDDHSFAVGTATYNSGSNSNIVVNGQRFFFNSDTYVYDFETSETLPVAERTKLTGASVVAIFDNDYELSTVAVMKKNAAGGGAPTMCIVTFNSNGGVPDLQTRSIIAGNSLGASMPRDPWKEYYVFMGWNTRINGTGTAFNIDTTVNESITVFAQWVMPLSGGVTLGSGGGTINSEGDDDADTDDDTDTDTDNDTTWLYKLEGNIAILAVRGDVTVSGGTVSSTDGYSIATSGKVSVSGGIVEAGGITYYDREIVYSPHAILSRDGDVVISGGTVSSSGDASFAVTVHNQKSVITISGTGKVEAIGKGSVAIYTFGSVHVPGGAVEARGNSARAIDAEGNISVSGGMVRAIGNAYLDGESFYPHRAILCWNGDVAVSGGTVSANGENGMAIFADSDEATVKVSGTGRVEAGGCAIDTAGNVVISGGTVSGGTAIAITKTGVVAYLKNTCNGSLVFYDCSGMIVEVDTLSIPSSYHNTNTGLVIQAGGNSAVWDTSGAQPKIKFTLFDASIKSLDWGAKATDPGGSGPVSGGGGAPAGASISPSKTTFDINGGKDISINLDKSGFTMRDLKNGNTALKEGTDYTVSGNTVTIKAEYLASLGKGEHTIIFEMSGGGNPKLTITITDTTTLTEQQPEGPTYRPMAPTHAAGTRVDATKTNNPLFLNGKETQFPAVKISDYNWLKLRDFAMLLSGSSKQFSIDYDAATGIIDIRTNQAYQPIGEELEDKLAATEIAIASPQRLRVDGEFIEVAAYNIKGYNYFRLRDLAIILNFSVIYEDGTGKITLDFDNPYSE